MEDRRRRLSIPLIVWPAKGRNHSSNHSKLSPKSRNSVPILGTRSTAHGVDDIATESRLSLPAMPTQAEQVVQRVMTEPPRPPPPAVVAAHRSIGQPMTSTSRPGGAENLAASTSLRSMTRGRLSLNLSSRRRFSVFMGFLTLSSNSQKRGLDKRKHFEIIVTLLLFCVTAVICTPPQLSSLISRHRISILVAQFSKLFARLFHRHPLC